MNWGSEEKSSGIEEISQSWGKRCSIFFGRFIPLKSIILWHERLSDINGDEEIVSGIFLILFQLKLR